MSFRVSKADKVEEPPKFLDCYGISETVLRAMWGEVLQEQYGSGAAPETLTRAAFNSSAGSLSIGG